MTNFFTSTIVSISSIIVTIIGCCYFIDRISTADFRKQVANQLIGHSEIVGRTRLAAHIQRFINGTIANYFGGEFVSFRNIRRSFALTALALAVIVPLACIHNGKSPDDLLTIWGDIDSSTNLLMLSFLLVSCFVIDVVSFLQTAMFMRLTANVPHARDMLLMAIFDLIVTLNLFSMLFAAFLVPMTRYVDARGLQMDLKVSIVDEAPAQKDMLEEFRKEGATLTRLYVAGRRVGDDKWAATDLTRVALKGYTATEALNGFFLAAGAKREAIHSEVERQRDKEIESVSAAVFTSGLLLHLSLSA